MPSHFKVCRQESKRESRLSNERIMRLDLGKWTCGGATAATCFTWQLHPLHFSHMFLWGLRWGPACENWYPANGGVLCSSPCVGSEVPEPRVCVSAQSPGDSLRLSFTACKMRVTPLTLFHLQPVWKMGSGCWPKSFLGKVFCTDYLKYS